MFASKEPLSIDLTIIDIREIALDNPTEMVQSTKYLHNLMPWATKRYQEALPTPNASGRASKISSITRASTGTGPCTMLLSTPVRSFGPCAKHILSYFARAGLGQFWHYLDFSGHHKSGDARMLTRPLDHILASHVGVRFDGNECLGSFAPVAVADCSHTTFKDVRVGDDYGFQRNRRDVFAA